MIDTAMEVKRKVQQFMDEYAREETVLGPELPIGYGTWARLVLVTNDSGALAQVRVRRHWNEWSFFENAADSMGFPLATIQLQRDVMPDGGVAETHGVWIEPVLLDLWRATGVDIKVFGNRHSVVVQLPSWYVQGFIDGTMAYAKGSWPKALKDSTARLEGTQPVPVASP